MNDTTKENTALSLDNSNRVRQLELENVRILGQMQALQSKLDDVNKAQKEFEDRNRAGWNRLIWLLGGGLVSAVMTWILKGGLT